MKKRLLSLLAMALIMAFALSSCSFLENLINPPTPEDPPKEFAVYFLAGDGIGVPAQTVLEGELVTEPTAPEKNGYTFGGWYKDSEFTEKWDFDSDVVTKNTIIYGKWIENPHECVSACEICGKCQNSSCGEDACASKCQGHEAPHECGSICEECGLCLDTECADDVCAEKCQGHAPDNSATPTIFLAGDSTVKTYDDAQYIAGWGQYLDLFLDESITVVNAAHGGRSSRSFINEGRLYNIDNANFSYTFSQNGGNSIEDSIKAGDFLFIQFGHNDDASKPSNYSTMYDRMVPLGEPDENGIYPTIPAERTTTSVLPEAYTKVATDAEEAAALATIAKYGTLDMGK